MQTLQNWLPSASSEKKEVDCGQPKCPSLSVTSQWENTVLLAVLQAINIPALQRWLRQHCLLHCLENVVTLRPILGVCGDMKQKQTFKFKVYLRFPSSSLTSVISNTQKWGALCTPLTFLVLLWTGSPESRHWGE